MFSRLNRPALALFLLSACAAAAMAGAPSGTPVAIIEDYSGDASQYRVTRGEAEIGVKALMELHSGDRVLLNGEEGELTLAYYDGDRVEINAGSRAHRVAEAQNEKTVAGNLLRWATSLIGDWGGKKDASQYASLISRGEVKPLGLPLLADGSIVQAGKRDLHVEWAGGKAPYDLTLSRILPAEHIVASLEKLDDRFAVLEGLRLKKGTYNLEIVDTRGVSVHGLFEARNDLGALQAPAAHLESQSSDAYKATVSALFLAATGDHQFAFESYQRLSPHAADYEPAAIARRSLAQGIRPTPPE